MLKKLSQKFTSINSFKGFCNHVKDRKYDSPFYDHFKLPKLFTDTMKQQSNFVSQFVDEALQEINSNKRSEEIESAFNQNKNSPFEISREAYQEFLSMGVQGDASKFLVNKTEVILIGTVYDKLPIENLYKLLNYVKPDLIVLQQRPDRYFSGIYEMIENLSKKGLKSTDFLEKITRKAYEIQTSLASKENVKKKLLAKGIILNREKELINSQKFDKIQTSFNEELLPERLSSESLSLISLWGEQKEVDVIIGDFPEVSLVNKLSNKLTLSQIKEIFRTVFNEFPNNPDFEPNTPLGTAINLFPDLFVHNSDAYMSQLIHLISSKPEFENKRVISFVGYGQNNTIPIYLEYDKDRNSIEKSLSPIPRYNSMIFGPDNLEFLIEKWAYLSLIINGVEKYVNELEISNPKNEFPGKNEFDLDKAQIERMAKDERRKMIEKRDKNDEKNANKLKFANERLIDFLIRKYAREEMIQTGFNDEKFMINKMKFLFEEMIKEKRKEAILLVKEGIENKKKSWMRRIINDPFLNAEIGKK